MEVESFRCFVLLSLIFKFFEKLKKIEIFTNTHKKRKNKNSFEKNKKDRGSEIVYKN